MSLLVGSGMLCILLVVVLILLRWGRLPLHGKTPVASWIFVAILFTSGLDVGLVMFPLTEFPVYDNLAKNSEYAFANPLAIEFGFWGFMVWAIYFVTCFYFCALEPRLQFFRIRWVKWLNNAVIIGTCAFTAHLLFANLSWYLPSLSAGDDVSYGYFAIVGLTIMAAVYSSTELKYVKILSVTSGAVFFALAIGLGIYAVQQPNIAASDYLSTLPLLTDYFTHLYKFVLPINDYHAFYLFWWFAWSIMIGQFTSRFVGNMKAITLFIHMLLWPSISLGLWFAVLYLIYINGVDTSGLINQIMVAVGIVFVLNSLDSLIRLYSDNLNLTVERYGKAKYLLLHGVLMLSLTALFGLQFIRIQWIGALVIGIGLCCVIYLSRSPHRGRLPAAQSLVKL